MQHPLCDAGQRCETRGSLQLRLLAYLARVHWNPLDWFFVFQIQFSVALQCDTPFVTQRSEEPTCENH